MKQSLRILALAAFFSCLGTGMVNAGGGDTTEKLVAGPFYSKATAVVTPTGAGKVYVQANSATDNPDYKDSAVAEYNAEVEYDQGKTEPTKATHTYYFYAQPEPGYIFSRWLFVNNTTNATSQASFLNPYNRNVSTDSKSAENPFLLQLQAEFIPTPPLQVAPGNFASVSATKIGKVNANGSFTETKVVKIGDKVRISTGVVTTGTGMGTLKAGRSFVFDGWYNKAGELVSTDETYEFVIPEGFEEDIYTANYKFVPLLTGDGFYRIRWIYSEQYWIPTGNYDPTPAMFTNHESRKINGALDLTERNDYTSPGAVLKLTSSKYNLSDDFTNNATVAEEVNVEGQGTSTKKILSKYTINIKSGYWYGCYKFVSSSVQIASNEHGSNDLGYLYVRQDQTSLDPDADAYFDFEPIDEAHVDRFYWGATCDPLMTFDDGYWCTMYTSFPYYLYDEGMEAYYIPEIKEVDGEYVAILEKIADGKVPANTAVMLKCPGTAPIENRMIPSMEDYPALDSNLLKGVFQLNESSSKPNHVVVNDNMRVLGLNDENVPGFYKMAAGTELTANRAYLDVTGVPARSNIRIAPSQSGIDNIISESRPAVSTTIYDVYGRAVKRMIPGNLYIVNGKKILYRE